MPETMIERLDKAIDAVLAGRRDDLVLADPELATFLVLAEDLRDLPNPSFKARLKSELIPASKEESMSAAVETAIRHSVTPYLLADNAEDLIEFLRNAFGGEELFRATRPDGTIMHAEVRIGDSVVEMGQTVEQWKPRRIPLHLYVPDADAVYERAIRAGATSIEEPIDQPYGDRESGVEDRWGNQWWIATRQENVAEEEIMRRFEGRGTPTRKDPSVSPVPPGLRTVTVGLRVRGAERMITFLEQVFDATVGERTTLPDGTLIHVMVRIGDSTLELGEAHGQWGPMEPAIHLLVDEVDAVYRRAIEAGSTSLYPPTDFPYGERGGGVLDPFGNTWFIATVKSV